MRDEHHKEKKNRIVFYNMIFNFHNNLYDNTFGELYASYEVIDELNQAQDVMVSTYTNIINERNDQLNQAQIHIDRLIKKASKLKKKIKDQEREQMKKEKHQQREQRLSEKKIIKFLLNPEAKEFIPTKN